jgi:DNA-binding NtrC family response regulator
MPESVFAATATAATAIVSQGKWTMHEGDAFESSDALEFVVIGAMRSPLREIGEIDASIQVKLLRVLQSRAFSRLGETAVRKFRGKIIAATNCDVAAEMRCGRFREDFYYRICSDVIEVPSLSVRIADNPDELVQLVSHLIERATGAEASDFAQEVLDWVDRNLGRQYAWPGNVGELEQCVRNILIRRRYAPAKHPAPPAADSLDQLMVDIADARLTADELLRRYCTLAFAKMGSYEAAARMLKIDRRTVRAKVDASAIEKLKGRGG